VSLDFSILGFLDRAASTGYDLKTRAFDTELAHAWSADQAQVYRTLDRLVERRFATVRLVPQRGRPDRKVYSITPSGRAALYDWLSTPHTVPPIRDPLLVQLYFAGRLPDAGVLALIQDARGAYQDRLERLRLEVAAMAEPVQTSRGEGDAEGAGDAEDSTRPPASGPTEERDRALRRMTLLASTTVYRALVDWADDCAENVRSGLPPEQTALDLTGA
jgi:PadR family transcriptional regulator AphA